MKCFDDKILMRLMAALIILRNTELCKGVEICDFIDFELIGISLVKNISRNSIIVV